jgi:hypothetical protein
MRKRTLILALVLAAAGSAAGARQLFRIELRGGAVLLARDEPIRRGSVLVFHRQPGGLTGVPIEDVLRIVPAGGRAASPAETATVAAAPEPLRPGDAVEIGRTGSLAAPRPDATATSAAAGPSDGSAGGLSYTTLGSGQTGYVATANGLIPVAPAGAVAPIGSSGLPTALSGPPPTTDANGMPLVGSGEPPTAGANGPVASTGGVVIVYPGTNRRAAVASTGVDAFTSNGFPQTGGIAAQTANPQLAPNGFPQAGPMTGAAAATPQIAPNGFPQMGAAANPQIAPNGFPATPGAGTQTANPQVAPNGFPAVAPGNGTNGQAAAAPPNGGAGR